MHKTLIPSHGLRIWMQGKATMRNGMSRTDSTVNEYRSCQRRHAPEATAELLALPVNGPLRCGVVNE